MKIFITTIFLLGVFGCTNQLQILGEPRVSYFRDSLSSESFDSTKSYYFDPISDSIHFGSINLRNRLWVYWRNGVKSYKVYRDGLPVIYHSSITLYDSLGKKKKHVVFRKKIINNWRYNKKQKFYTSGKLDSVRYFDKKGILKKIKYRNHYNKMFPLLVLTPTRNTILKTHIR